MSPPSINVVTVAAVEAKAAVNLGTFGGVRNAGLGLVCVTRPAKCTSASEGNQTIATGNSFRRGFAHSEPHQSAYSSW